MKANEQHCHMVQFIMLCKLLLLIMLYEVVLPFESVGKIL